MAFRSLLCVAFAALAAGACAIVDPVDQRYDTVSRSLAKARNNSIFLNLIRASRDYPLSFVTIANVNPSLSNSTSLGLPGYLLGPASALFPSSTVPFGDTQIGSTVASNSTAVATSFNVSTQETRAFYQGLLKPVDLQTVAYFIRQGYQPELLFWLFTDSFELDLHGRKFGYRYDPPANSGCAPLDPKRRCFIDWVRIATAAGLTVEEVTVQDKTSPGKGATSFARFCFNSVLQQRAAIAMGPERTREILARSDVPITRLTPKCGTKWDPSDSSGKPQPDVVSFHIDGVTIRISPRSTYGVFEFLGTLIKMQRDQLRPLPRMLPPGREDILLPPTLLTAYDDPQLMSVGPGGGRCFARTWFGETEYCVPEEAATTKRIFGLLAQLIAIQTAANDLSITPIVRTVP